MKKEQLRKVEFKENQHSELQNGLFHKFSINSYSDGDNIGHFPVGIIEKLDGTIKLIHVEYIKFL